MTERQAALEKLAEAVREHLATLDNAGMYGGLKQALAAIDAPKHAFPESDDELEGEMFEDDGALIVKEGPAHGMRMCCDKDGRRWAWRTVSEIRTCTPLGPSPRKRRLQALERVAKASSAYFTCDGEDKLFVKTALTDALADLEALEAANDTD